jgi:hypothetical protein
MLYDLLIYVARKAPGNAAGYDQDILRPEPVQLGEQGSQVLLGDLRSLPVDLDRKSACRERVFRAV